MIRVLLILGLIAALGAGFAWIADMPGNLVLTFGGLRYETSLVVALVALLVVVVLLSLLWSLVRFVLRIPGIVSLSRRLRRREKALKALSRGIVAAGAGDARAAHRASMEVQKHLPDEPLAMLLEAQSAQLRGDRVQAERTFARMAQQPETRLLGLRGLHVEARRRGDMETAHRHAVEAHALAPVDWAGHAVLEHHVGAQSWDRALAAVDANQAHKLIDRRTANRQRAVIKTAQAIDLGARDPDKVVALCREAIKLAPDLVPAIVLAGRTLSRKGDVGGAAKVLEAGWKRIAHPEIAAAYLDARPGDSARDRLARAETLARLDNHAPESRMTVARAALETRDFARARAVMGPITGPGSQPTRRMCLIMADIEETENGTTGALREWLARAARAPRDPVWIADGIASDVWAPTSPLDGRLDAYEWKVPQERFSRALEPLPDFISPEPAEVLAGGDAPLIEHEAAPEASELEPADVSAEEAHSAGTLVPEAPAASVAPAAPASAEAVSPAEPAGAEKPVSSGSGTGTPVTAARSAALEPLGAGPTRSFGPRPVMFPHPMAPDDPGPPRPAPADDLYR